MTEDRFWKFLAEARSGDPASATPKRLTAVLSSLSNEEVTEFGAHFYDKVCDLNDWKLWGAGYVIAGGMSDDSFHYFRTWIVGKGEEVFRIALENPDDLGPYVDNPEVENELLEYVTIHTLERRGSKTDPRDLSGRNADANPSGEPFEEETGRRFISEARGSVRLGLLPLSLPRSCRLLRRSTPIRRRPLLSRTLCMSRQSQIRSRHLRLFLQRLLNRPPTLGLPILARRRISPSAFVVSSRLFPSRLTGGLRIRFTQRNPRPPRLAQPDGESPAWHSERRACLRGCDPSPASQTRPPAVEADFPSRRSSFAASIVVCSGMATTSNA